MKPCSFLRGNFGNRWGYSLQVWAKFVLGNIFLPSSGQALYDSELPESHPRLLEHCVVFFGNLLRFSICFFYNAFC